MTVGEAREGERALRADARRNLELVLEAAAAAFAERGLDACVADIARRAGVGQATVFRRFPTKDDLVEAVFEMRLRELIGHAESALEVADPAEGLRAFVEAAVELHLRDRGFLQAAATRLFGEPRCAVLRDEIHTAVGRLVRRARRAGAVREGVEATDVPVLVNAIAFAAAMTEPAAPGLWRRYVTVVLDGLRPGHGTRLRPAPPTVEQFEQSLRAAAVAPRAR